MKLIVLAKLVQVRIFDGLDKPFIYFGLSFDNGDLDMDAFAFYETAESVETSLKVGDPVIVKGSLVELGDSYSLSIEHIDLAEFIPF